MPSMASLIMEATKPGLLGRAGISLEVRLARDLTAYFTQMQASINLEHLQHDETGMIEPHLLSIVTRGSKVLGDILLQHGKVGFIYGGRQTAMYESSFAEADLLVDQQGAFALDKLGTTGKQAVAYAKVRAAQSVTGIDETTRQMIRNIIADGIENQSSTFDIVKNLKKLFGEMSTTRARSIANTEMNMAMSTASFAKIKTVGLNYKRSIPSPGACPICIRNFNAGAIPVDQPFPSGHLYTPFHPGRCRCAITGVRDERVKEYGENSSGKE